MCMFTQKHLIQFAAVSILFVVSLGSNNSVAKEKHHNTIILEKHKHSNKSIKKNKPMRGKLPKITTVGIASYYGFESGNITATGERFKPLGLTAAHRTLPFNTRVRVTNLKNNKSVVVRINDRGPFVKGRIIDLSLGSARVIGVRGLSRVKLEIL